MPVARKEKPLVLQRVHWRTCQDGVAKNAWRRVQVRVDVVRNQLRANVNLTVKRNVKIGAAHCLAMKLTDIAFVDSHGNKGLPRVANEF